MDEVGGLSFESVLIVATALAVVAGGLAGFKASQPQQWRQLSVALSDVTRDVSWQAQQAVAQWGADPVGALKSTWREAAPPDVGAVTLRPAPDPLAQLKALR